MKTKIATVMLCSAMCALVVGCATPISVQPTVNACEVIYFDIEQDSLDTIRQGATNNEMVENSQ